MPLDCAVALREAMNEVEKAAREGRWTQQHWTVPNDGEAAVTGCFLAHRAALDGASVVIGSGTGWLPIRGDMLLPDGWCITGREIAIEDMFKVGRRGVITWERWASRRLGLTRREFEAITDAHITTVARMRAVVERIADEELRPEIVEGERLVALHRDSGW